MKKMETMKLQGKEYATVATRIKEFRQDCPNGLIETKFEKLESGEMVFEARILKDKANQNSGEATGHSIGKITGDKAFEKLETIAIGRALALLGYMASGEIASSDEMERFMEFKQLEWAKTLNACETLEALQVAWASLPGEAKIPMTQLKEQLKSKLS